MGKNFKDYFTKETGKEVKEAFINGYIVSLKSHRVYDPALFLSGAELESHILGDLIAQETRAETAMRAKTRMIISKFDFSDEQKKVFQSMVFPPETIDDNGQPVDID